MKIIFCSLIAVIVVACGSNSSSTIQDVPAFGKAPSNLLLTCSDPTLSDAGFYIVIAMNPSLQPVKADVNERSRAGTKLLATNSHCEKLDTFDPTLADGAQPEYKCIDPTMADGGFVVELTDGNRAGRKFVNVSEISRRGTRLVAEKLVCIDAQL